MIGRSALEAALGLEGQLLNDDDPADEDQVSLGTMHRAKGLEFKAVANRRMRFWDFCHCSRSLKASRTQPGAICSSSRSEIFCTSH